MTGMEILKGISSANVRDAAQHTVFVEGGDNSLDKIVVEKLIETVTFAFDYKESRKSSRIR